MIPLLSDESSFQVSILAYCLMSNHYHLLIRQNREKGVEKFMSDSVNAFTRHINVKSKRKGPIFLPRFKAVQVTSDEHLRMSAGISI